MNLDNFFTSGQIFNGSKIDLKSKYQMINIGLLVSTFGLSYAVIVNYIRDISYLIPFELFIISVNIVQFFILRIYKESLKIVSITITSMFTFFYLFLIYFGEPSELKHIWLFTYPIILLYFETRKNGLYWMIFFLAMLLIAPYQSFIEVKYSAYQIQIITVVLFLISVIISFYQVKMNEAIALILDQQKMLSENNIELAQQVKELKDKDKLLTAQSKQAVMGEMISMIAHQWRQPLSTITLQISKYQIEQLLHSDKKEREIDKTLSEISDTIIYLSETIDDFQTYFQQDKEITEVKVCEIIKRVNNFIAPRMKEIGLEIEVQKDEDIVVHTYLNEIIQVLLNIFNNAIDALKSDKIKKPKISISFMVVDEMVEVQVKDNAFGIDAEILDHLFEPYFSTKGKNGTGLGLYMSQMIMQKQFESEIEVQTSEKGSIFKLKIPKNIS